MTSNNLVKIGDTWVESQNAWITGLTNGNWVWESSLVGFTLFFLLVNYLSKIAGKWYGYPLSVRPTLVASAGHAAVTAVASCVVVYLGPEHYWIWQKIFLAFSGGYFIHDIIIYSYPQNDWLMTIHHLTFILSSFPVGEDDAAFWYGAGDPKWPIWGSMFGYTTEFAIPLLGYRWWMSHTLERQTLAFSVTGVLIMFFFSVRCVIVTLLIKDIVSRFQDFVEYKQLAPFTIVLVSFLVFLLLAMHWLRLILREGVVSYLRFKKQPRLTGPFKFSSGNFAAAKAESKDSKDGKDGKADEKETKSNGDSKAEKKQNKKKD